MSEETRDIHPGLLAEQHSVRVHKSHEQLLQEASRLGLEAGTNAASWYFDRDQTDEDFKRVLKGLEEGDPVILDTLPGGWLSGEFADDPTPQLLYRDLGMTDDQIEVFERYGLLDSICEAYTVQADMAAEAGIVQYAQDQLRRDILFKIDVTVPLHEEDADKLLAGLVDYLVQHNCDLLSDEWEES